MTIPREHLARLRALCDHYSVATSEMVRRMIDREYGLIPRGEVAIAEPAGIFQALNEDM